MLMKSRPPSFTKCFIRWGSVKTHCLRARSRVASSNSAGRADLFITLGAIDWPPGDVQADIFRWEGEEHHDNPFIIELSPSWRAGYRKFSISTKSETCVFR